MVVRKSDPGQQAAFVSSPLVLHKYRVYWPSRPGIMSYVTWTSGTVTSTATNMGSITTIFTPPSSCVSVVTMYKSISYLYLGHFGQGDPACFPLSRPIFDFGNDYFYSPGICPHDWTSLPIASGALPPQLGSSVLCCPPCVSHAENTRFSGY